MSETLRDLVVSLSLQTDNFTRNIKSVNKQIAEAESKFKLAAAGVEGFERTATGLATQLSTLERRLSLQKDAVTQYERALTAANEKLTECYNRQNDYAQRLTDAKTAHQALKEQVSAAAQQVHMVPMIVADDGTLVMEEDGAKLIFAKADTTSTEPEAPVIDAEAIAAVGSAGVAYIGTWQADTLEMDGDVYPLADMGMEMSFTLNADGTAESFDGETTETGTWSLENGLLILDGVAMLPNEEGQLIMEEDGMKLVFVKSDAASATEEEGFTGVWYGCYMVTGAMNGDPRTLFEITLTINEDGTANLAYPTDEFWHWTENEDGSLLMVKDSDDMEMPLHKLDENFLCFGSTDGDGNAFGGYIIFSRDVQAIWTPDMLLQPDVSAETATSVDVSAEYSDKFERKYICTSAQSSGITMDASLLGGEYALTFHANGTVDFVMVGTEIVGLPWTTGDNAFIIDYYGTKLEVVFTEEGVDMDYFSMLMHFVPEA